MTPDVSLLKLDNDRTGISTKWNSADRQNFDAYDIAQNQILPYRQNLKVLGYQQNVQQKYVH